MTFQHYHMDPDDPELAARGLINLLRDQLIALRERTDNRQELEWEIRLYDFMLGSPAERLKAYQAARFDRGRKVLIPKRKAVARLGWEIR